MAGADIITDAAFDPESEAAPEVLAELSNEAGQLLMWARGDGSFDGLEAALEPNGVTFHERGAGTKLYEAEIKGDGAEAREVIARFFLVDTETRSRVVDQNAYDLLGGFYQHVTWREAISFAGDVHVEIPATRAEDPPKRLTTWLAAGLQQNVIEAIADRRRPA